MLPGARCVLLLLLLLLTEVWNADTSALQGVPRHADVSAHPVGQAGTAFPG